MLVASSGNRILRAAAGAAEQSTQSSSRRENGTPPLPSQQLPASPLQRGCSSGAGKERSVKSIVLPPSGAVSAAVNREERWDPSAHLLQSSALRKPAGFGRDRDSQGTWAFPFLLCMGTVHVLSRTGKCFRLKSDSTGWGCPTPNRNHHGKRRSMAKPHTTLKAV